MRRQTRGEEIANSTLHGIGAVLSIAALVILVVFASRTGDDWRVASLSIYGMALIVLYLSSTFYHSLVNIRIKRFFKILDHCSIYFLIAGTYTPVVLVTLRGPWGWTLFGLIWTMAIVGIIFKFISLKKYKFISVVSYIVMGWLVVIALKPLIENSPEGFFKWLLIGGLSYTIGIIFYAWKKLPYHHAVWHLFVLGGSFSHFFGFLFYIAQHG
ncbi:MAG: hemolysin III family protein [Candidatus Omnitrophica bacterium]|nr:hemolysin III family protein [Candidatus Omnitrophota bacterium]